MRVERAGIYPPRDACLSPRQLGLVRGRHRDVRSSVLRAAAHAAIQPRVRGRRRGKRSLIVVAERRPRGCAVVLGSGVRRERAQTRHDRLAALLGRSHIAHGVGAGMDCASGAANLARSHLERAARRRDDLPERGDAFGIHRPRDGSLHRGKCGRRAGRAADVRCADRIFRLALSACR